MKSKKVSVTARRRRLFRLATIAILLSATTACNVVRTITTESSSVQRGDTSTIIQTKTIESYSAKKM